MARQRALAGAVGVGALALLAVAPVASCRERPASSAAPTAVASADPLAAPSDLRSPPADALRSHSGLQSRVLREGHGERKPQGFDRVSLHYTGWTERGAVFASSIKRGAPVTFVVDEAMAGWAEGLQLMVVGEKRRLWIPQGLAYEGKPDQPQGPLVLDVELLQVVPGIRPLAPPPDLAGPPRDAERTASGLSHQLLRPGTSQRRPSPYDRVRIAYAGWSSDGRMIDSSQARGDEVEVAVSYGFPGWREALQLMREGEKRRFWIPEALASRSYPVAVRGMLVFDIELRRVIAMPAPPPVPEDVAAPPKDAVHTGSGLAYRVLRKGTGTRKPDLESTVEVHYSYWTSDGRLVDSTIPGGAPHRAELEDGDLPPGLTEAVQLMVVGEKRRLWLPPQLGFADKGKPRGGALVFDLELFALYQGEAKVEWVEPKQP